MRSPASSSTVLALLTASAPRPIAPTVARAHATPSSSITAASLAVPIRAALDIVRAPHRYRRAAGEWRIARARATHHGAASHARRDRARGRGGVPEAARAARRVVVRAIRAQSHGARLHRSLRGRRESTSANWYRVLLRPDVRVGRSDPELAPVGYRTLAVYRLAERYYRVPGLAARLEARTPPGAHPPERVRARRACCRRESSTTSWTTSRSHAPTTCAICVFPPEIDLGDPARAAEYARASVRVARRTDTVTYTGAPIVYGIGVPRDAPHRGGRRTIPRLPARAEGRALLGAHAVDVLPRPEFVGDSVPAVLRSALPVTTSAPTRPRDASRRRDRRGRRFDAAAPPPRTSHRGAWCCAAAWLDFNSSARTPSCAARSGSPR